jgi:hypothetical protein
MLGGALSFYGNGDYVSIPDADSLTPSSAMTISYWVQIGAEGGAGVYKLAFCPNESDSPGRSRAYYLSVSGPDNNVYFRIHSATNTYDNLISTSEVLPGQWQHISATFDAGEAAIYINGQLDSSATMTVSSIMNDVQPLTIGGLWSYCGADHFVNADGIIDDLRIYDRALSAGEIEELYEEEGDPFLAKFVVVRKERVSRTVFEYDCDVVLRNLSLEMAEWPGNITLIKPNVSFGRAVIGPGESGTSIDMCTFRVDRSEAIDPTEIIWDVTAETAEAGATMEHLVSTPVPLCPPINDNFGLKEIAAQWLRQGPAGWIEEDSAQDGTVNLADFAKFAQQWKTE